MEGGEIYISWEAIQSCRAVDKVRNPEHKYSTANEKTPASALSRQNAHRQRQLTVLPCDEEALANQELPHQHKENIWPLLFSIGDPKSGIIFLAKIRLQVSSI